CKMAERRINVFVPPISNFPEILLGGYALKDRIQVLPQSQGQRAKPKATEALEERQLQYLYVIDSQGRLLEHMRYSGSDYRAALREAFAPETMSTKAALNSHTKPNLGRK
ncbi:hypothetical protein KR038_007861, partial [Drosophila bunnanda]